MNANANAPTRTAAAAYRKDLAGRPSGAFFTGDDGAWIAVATIVQHAANSRGDGGAGNDALRTLIREGARVARSTLGEEASSPAVASVLPGNLDHESETIRCLAERMEEAGALYLAGSTLDALARSGVTLSTLEQGRTLAQAARTTWKRGELDQARAMYKRVARLGNAFGEQELRARAWIGYAAIAQMEGDYDHVCRWSRAAARVADRLGAKQLQRLAYSGLMLAAAKAGLFDEALVHGWTVYELGLDDPIATAAILTNLGQLLLEAGLPDVSRATFAAVLSTPQPARVGLPALGGLALASAHAGDRTTVEWAAGETRREARAGGVHQPFVVASALVDCAFALARVADLEAAESCRGDALALASRHGYHDLIVRARELAAETAGATRREPAALAPRALRVTRKLESLAPQRLPEHVSFLAA